MSALSEVAKLLTDGLPLVVDEEAGVYLARLPTPASKYSLVLDPTYCIQHTNWFKNGTEVITIKRVEK